MPQQDSQPVGVELAASLSQVAERSLNIMTDFLKRTQSDDFYTVLDPFVITKTFQQMATRALMDPWLLMQQQLSLWTDWVELLKRSSERLYLNKESEPVALPAPEDKRFKDDHWVQDFVFDFIKQSYLLASRHIQETVAKVPGLDEHTARKLSFYTRQVVGALSPTNFAATNPQVIKATVESGGENLLKGLGHLLADLERGKGRLAIRMTDLEAFKLGENIAATPGKVVFQNEMMQLLHYQPTTEQVFKRPLLIVPPWINKFYILDLKPKNSFIKWALDQGHSVFLISWINPDASYADKGFDDYVLHGTLAAVNAIEAITGETEINALGYCIGGTLLASTRAYMATQGDERLASLTFFPLTMATLGTTYEHFTRKEPAAEEKLQQALERRLQSVSITTDPTPADRRNVRDVALTLLMWKAGLRVSEIVALDVSDVKIQSSQRGVVQVRLGKGRKSRNVPLNAQVIAALKMWLKLRPAEDTALFLSRSNIRLTTRAVQQIVEQIGREAAALVKARSAEAREVIAVLNALTPHVLRHTCAKRLLDAGAQLTEVATILGHEDLNMTRRYTQPSTADLQRAVDRT